MTIRYSKTIVAVSMAAALAACGGGDQSAGEAVEEGAAEVAETASEVVDEAGAALDEAGDEVAAAADEATDDAAAMVDEGSDEVANASEATVEGADEAASEMTADAEGGWTDLKANWQDSVESIQAKWGELSEEDLLGTGGDREQFVSLIQEKYNLGAEEAEQQVSDWEATL